MKRNNPEEQLQISCVEWFRLQYPRCVLFAIPNGGRRNIREAARLKKGGVLSGVSDLFLPEPRGSYHGLWIEMKSGKGRLSKAQQDFMKSMSERGYETEVAYDFQDFKAIVEDYLRC